MATVRFRGSRADVTRVALELAQVLAGKRPDTHRVARGFMLSLGFAALSDIKEAYITKARGGTDEMGVKWPPLDPKTIAARRVGPRDRHQREIAERERIRERETKKALARFRLTLPQAEALRRARIVGGLKATRETERTKTETLGSRQVEILRDTGVLLNSLSPGRLDFSGGVSYTPPGGEGADEQIFEVARGEVIVGTNVKYASTHQNGRGGIPARPFLPDESHPVPAVWWARWVRVANKALVAGAEILYRK